MRYIGLDLGTKTLGIALSDPTNTIASIYKTIFFKEEDYQSLIAPLKEIISNYDIAKIVLGFPKNMNNTIGPRAQTTIEFKEIIERELGKEVVLQDERLTSVMSNYVLIEADVSRKKRKKKVDGIAAQIILQNFLEQERNKKNEK